MFDVNIKIIEDLKNFITTVSGNREILNKFCANEKDFTRSRKLPFKKLTLLILKLCKKTLSIELENFFEEMGCSMSCSVSAFIQQRIKLEPVFFNLWNMILQRSYYYRYGDAVKRWKGHQVVAVDGSSVAL